MSYSLLPKETVDNPNSLDDFFKEMHEAYKKRNVPMTEDQARAFISITTASSDQIDEMYADLESDSWIFKGLFRRCGIFPIKYEKRLLVWLALMTYRFNIGGMILVAYYVQWFAAKECEKSIIFKNEIELDGLLTLDAVIEKCFPFGVFNKETVHEFWDKQKVHASPDNLIDHPRAGLSFMPIEDLNPIKP